MDDASSARKHFLLIGRLEAISFLVLLFVAMPLKYYAGMPLAVRIVGALHGALFVWFMVALARAASACSWPLGRTALAAISSVVPFAYFVFEGSVRREDSRSSG